MVDNCEHLIEGCSTSCGRPSGRALACGYLATSREALSIAGEAVWAGAASSPIPEQQHSSTVEELEGYESVRASRLSVPQIGAVTLPSR